MKKQEMINELNRITGLDKKRLNELSTFVIKKAYYNECVNLSQLDYLKVHLRDKRLRRLGI